MLSAGSAVILRINCSIGVIPVKVKDGSESLRMIYNPLEGNKGDETWPLFIFH